MKKCTSFEEQKGTRYIRGSVYFGIIAFSCLSSTKSCLRFILISFSREIKGCGFLTNELRVSRYDLQVTIYCTSYELLFTYKLQITIYCTSYDLLFTYELQVITYCTSYELIFMYELRVTIYCTSYKLN